MKRTRQRSMHCGCGRLPIVARGLCATCYSLKRQDAEYFAGLREAVLDRDGRRCRVCEAPGGRKGSLAVHHRVAGRSELGLMITLCPACHAKVTRTLAVDSCWPPLLIQLWREQHPDAHEQLQLDFTIPFVPPVPVPLWEGEKQAMEMPDHGKPGERKNRFPTFPPPLEARQ